MSKAPWKTPPHRRPRISSSEIPVGEWLSQANVLGSQALRLRPMFTLDREELEARIEDGSFPVPMRVLGTGPRGQLLWPSDTIKAYIEDCEAEKAAKLAAKPAAPPVPEGWSNTAAVCKRFGVSRQTINLWVHAGRLARPQVFGGRPAWSPEQIEAAAKWRMPVLLPYAEAVDESKYVSIRALTVRLGISRERLQELILAGKIPAPVEVGGYGVYPRTVLEQLERGGL